MSKKGKEGEIKVIHVKTIQSLEPLNEPKEINPL